MGALEGFPRVFLDSSFLVALYGTGDTMHPRALELLADAEAAGSELCTIWDCVSESMTVLRRHFGYRAACALADSLDDLTMVTYDTSHRIEAVRRFRRRARKRPLSFVDVLCSVVISEVLGGAPAMSFDRDFASLGLTVIA
jgi:predicted nucleic acid-binding protein